MLLHAFEAALQNMINSTPRVQRSFRSAFTLVELVVVVLIIGILAAVAAPKMFDTATEARESGTRQSQSVIRDAIELYKSRTGSYPTAANIQTELADYLKGAFPSSQVGDNKNNNVVAGTLPLTAVVAGGAGWAYDATAGDIAPNATGVYQTW